MKVELKLYKVKYDMLYLSVRSQEYNFVYYIFFVRRGSLMETNCMPPLTHRASFCWERLSAELQKWTKLLLYRSPWQLLPSERCVLRNRLWQELCTFQRLWLCVFSFPASITGNHVMHCQRSGKVLPQKSERKASMIFLLPAGDRRLDTGGFTR